MQRTIAKGTIEIDDAMHDITIVERDGKFSVRMDGDLMPETKYYKTYSSATRAAERIAKKYELNLSLERVKKNEVPSNSRDLLALLVSNGCSIVA